MNKKYIGILIIVIGLIALVGVIYFMFFYDFSPESITEEVEEQTQEQPAETQEQPAETQPKKAVISIKEQPQAEKVTEEDLKRIAASFAERFGSYSNQSNYGNIRDLKIFMSSKMLGWADGYIKKEMSKNADSSIYIGMTTKAASVKVKQFDDDLGKAEILVSTQRRMSTGTLSNMVSYQQDIEISFIKEREAWKVDSAEWEDVM
jgi:hypothetical protein